MEVKVPARPEPIKLDLKRTALIVVDMHAFSKKGGLFDFLGRLDEVKVKSVIEKDREIIDACRNKGIKIIYLRMGYRADLSNAGGEESPNYFKELGLASMRCIRS